MRYVFDADRVALPHGRELVAVSLSDEDVTDLVARPVLGDGAGRGWLIAFIAASLGTIVMAGGLVWLLAVGVGIWGINSSVV